MMNLFKKTKKEYGGNTLDNWIKRNDITVQQINNTLFNVGILYIDIFKVKNSIKDNVLFIYITDPKKIDIKISLMENKNLIVECKRDDEIIKLEVNKSATEIVREEEALDYKAIIKKDKNLGTTRYFFEKKIKLEGVKANVEVISVEIDCEKIPNDIELLNSYLKTLEKINYGHIYSTIISLLGYVSWLIGKLNIRIEVKRTYDDERIIIPYLVEIKKGIVKTYISSIAGKGYFRYQNGKYYKNHNPDSEYVLTAKQHFGKALDSFHKNGFIEGMLFYIIKCDWKSNHFKFE